MKKIEENKLVKIPPYAKVKVYWDDNPENYSREGRNRVQSYFSRKYGVTKTNVNVVFRPTKIDKNGNEIEISGAGIDNIMDSNYQRGLMKEWIERNEKKVDFQRIVKLDEKVNGSLEIDVNEVKHRRWEIKWLSINNFLCYGENNYVNFGKLKGLSIINSTPKNQGGKTTFSVDAIKFLLFGKTTKTDTNAEVFNTFTNENKITLRGMITYDGKDIIIERVLSRTEKRAGGYTIKNKLSYYKLMPDGEEIILEEEDATSTTAEIKRTIGDESDFDITILTTAKNLEDLIDTTPTESGKLLTKFIGIEVIEMKEKIVRKMHNEYSKTMKSNHFNVEELKNEIIEHKEAVDYSKKLLIKQKLELDEIKSRINILNNDKDNLLISKKPVDVTISQLNPETIESEIKSITNKGKEFAESIKKYLVEINEIGNVTYDETSYFNLNKEYNALDAKLNANMVTKENHICTVDQLKNGEICPTCKRPLEDVDHSNEIKIEEAKIEKLITEHKVGTKKLEKIRDEINLMGEVKKSVDLKNKIELQKDRAEVEIEALRNKIKVKRIDLKNYNDNIETINLNRLIDSKIEVVKTNIVVQETKKDSIIGEIKTTESDITTNNTSIRTKETLIDTIGKEKEVDRLFKIYVEMIGKKGISKLILRSVLPIINSELYRLMDEVCDFEVELTINDKNDVVFILSKNGIEKKLKSGSGFEKTTASIALRCVLGKISHLPMPNFVTFDEPFGMVADVNLDKIKPMFDKIKDMYDIVFLISHIDTVKDWGDNVITVKKVKDISEISVK